MESGLLETLSFVGRETARFVLHASCAVCAEELPWRARTASCCTTCWDALPRITSAKCRSCARPMPAVEMGESILCIECQVDPLPLDWCDAWGHYRDGLERLLHAFKFAHHDFLDDALADLLLGIVSSHDTKFDVVLPVPMHRSKLRRRGYNQAELLARALAKRLRTRCDPELLTKRFERETQSQLGRSERAANVRDAFKASPKVKERTILIVDDVCTTGETLRACAAELKVAGATTVCAVAIAKA